MDNRPSLQPPGEPDPAKARFLVIQACRWSGMALVVAGLLVLKGKIPLPGIAGYPMVIAGLLDALIVPTILTRQWRSPRP